MCEKLQIEINKNPLSNDADLQELKKVIEIECDTTIQEVVSTIIQEDFFNNQLDESIWVLETAAGEEVLSFYPKTELIMPITYLNKVRDICDDNWKLYFTSYESPEDRAKHIFRITNGSKAKMINEGLDSEYDYYKINENIEKVWFEELKLN